MNEKAGSDYPEMNPREAEKRTEKVRVEVSDLANIGGTTSAHSFGVSTTPGEARVYAIQDVWDLTEVPDGKLELGMTNLRKGLREKGWEIVRFGHANSKARQLELEAKDEKHGYGLQAEVTTGSNGKRDKDGRLGKAKMLGFTLSSRNYRAPKGVDLDAES